MERQIHELVQGSDEWHQFRLNHFGASEAAAMLGMSKKTTRSELLRMKALGIAKEFSAYVQEKILDHGHEVEALARPLVEAQIGEDLYPATYSYGTLSASCDGLTMAGDTAFEHKQWNAELAAALDRGELPDEHQPQCQQIMHVTGAERVIFVCSDGTPERFKPLVVLPDIEWQNRIEAGWRQFAKDLADYQHVDVAPPPVAKPIDDLPALSVQLIGQVTSSNLVDWHGIVTARIQAINTDLQTDQDFADAEKTVKFLDDGEKKLELVKSSALAQTASIDELFRAIDSIKGEMRAKRLELDRLVTSRKVAIRNEIEQRGKQALAAHIASLAPRCSSFMPIVPADFAGKMKGKRTVASLNDAVDTELARAKIEADAIAERIVGNLNAYADLATGYEFLFADLRNLVNQPLDAFTAMVENRINKHAEAERKRVDEENARTAANVAGNVTAPVASAPAPAPAVTYHDVATSTAREVFAQGSTITGTGRLRDLIDDELRQMTADELQQALDALRNIRARKAA